MTFKTLLLAGSAALALLVPATGAANAADDETRLAGLDQLVDDAIEYEDGDDGDDGDDDDGDDGDDDDGDDGDDD